MKPDWTKKAYYAFDITDGDKTVRSGFFNEKAWNKTIENDILWEYLPDNGRVIEVSGVKPDMAAAKTEQDRVIVPMHTGSASDAGKKCDNAEVLAYLENVIRQRKAQMPPNSYTTHLFEKGEDKILKKLGEECIEVILAKNNDKDVIYESADLIYHLMVYLVYKNIPFNNILEELKARFQ